MTKTVKKEAKKGMETTETDTNDGISALSGKSSGYIIGLHSKNATKMVDMKTRSPILECSNPGRSTPIQRAG